MTGSYLSLKGKLVTELLFVREQPERYIFSSTMKSLNALSRAAAVFLKPSVHDDVSQVILANISS